MGKRANPAIVGAFVVGAIFVIINWIVDTLYGFVDPRIKLQAAT